MKVLLDECLPIAFRHSFPDHEVHSAEWAGFKGMKNGKLLRAAEEAGYDVLLTTDQGIPHQQSSADRRISVLVCAPPRIKSTTSFRSSLPFKRSWPTFGTAVSFSSLEPCPKGSFDRCQRGCDLA